MKELQWLLMYPLLWQTLTSSLFTLGLVWFLVRFVGIRSADTRVWAFSLPFVTPLFLPFKDSSGLIRPFLIVANEFWLQSPVLRIITFTCLLPFVAALLNGCLSYLSYRRFLRVGREITESDKPELFALLLPLTQKAGVRLPRVYLLPPDGGVKVFVCGTLQPRLVLAPILLTVLPEAELRAILAHEVAHLARRDQAYTWVTLLLHSLMFYNPALYFLRRWLGQARERAADALASEWTGDPKALAHGILHVTKLALKDRTGGFFPRPFPMTELARGEYHHERIQLLLTKPSQKDSKLYVGVFVFLFLSAEVIFTTNLLLPFFQHIPCIRTFFI
jgi:Zn-dependent protease with chaperone function